MKTFLGISILIFFTLSCKQNESNKALELEEKVNNVTHSDNIYQEMEKDICFETFLDGSLENYLITESQSKKISREGILDCFIKNNIDQFEKLDEEILYKVLDSTSKKEIINVKKMIFPNIELADYIFTEYSKGFHNKCIGIKEPNFIVKENNSVYVFFVRSEYFRRDMISFKEHFLNDEVLNRCPKVRWTECK